MTEPTPKNLEKAREVLPGRPLSPEADEKEIRLADAKLAVVQKRIALALDAARRAAMLDACEAWRTYLYGSDKSLHPSDAAKRGPTPEEVIAAAEKEAK